MSRRMTLNRPLEAVYSGIRAYYTDKVQKHGATPRGVDWTCVPTQELRFVQLLKLCDFKVPFSLNDVGCGYGALLAHLARRHPHAEVDYLGIDLSRAMVRHAELLWHNPGSTRFVTARTSPRVADYSVASGIFNVRLEQPIDVWERFIARTLADMQRTSRLGFSVNLMGLPAAGQASKEGLYRSASTPWVEYCERKLQCSVEVLSGYGLREFTLLARRLTSPRQ
jgi:SAM-dependent methyltransferase